MALHSRHPVLGDDGSFVNHDQFCLEQVLERRQYSPKQACTVYLMSDRPKTLQLLSDWLQNTTNCQPMVVASDAHETTSLRLTEHGPYAGRGYWQDWAMASQARTAVIGDPRRSSYMLVKELVMYDRIVEAYDKYGDINVTRHQQRMIECELPDRQSKGYSYGPGTPTFTHYSLAEPLVPVKILEDYKRVHRERVHGGGTESQTKYAIVHYACPLNDQGDGLERFLSGTLAQKTPPTGIVFYSSHHLSLHL